jgi:hypothetical protein
LIRLASTAGSVNSAGTDPGLVWPYISSSAASVAACSAAAFFAIRAASAAAALATPEDLRLAAIDAFEAIFTPSRATVCNRPNPNRAASINTCPNNCSHAV